MMCNSGIVGTYLFEREEVTTKTIRKFVGYPKKRTGMPTVHVT